MRTPTLKELPPPPIGKTGWPWTEETPQALHRMPSSNPWPRISIVTPSYNQGQFIEETIRSVLLQGYPNLEYIIIDGGSSDNTVDIIRKYESWISYWVSNKDDGQAHAINKGFMRTSGDIIAWLNSDDIYYPNVLSYVGNSYLHRTDKLFWLVLGIDYIDHEAGTIVTDFQCEAYTIDDWVYGNANPNQQGSFWSRSIILKFGKLLEDLHYGFDKEYFMRLIAHGIVFSRCVDKVAGCYRMHGQCKWKANNQGFKYDWEKIRHMYSGGDLDLRRAANDGMVHALIRMAQNPKLGMVNRWRKIGEAVVKKPSVIFRKDFFGTLKRLATGVG